MYLILIKNGPLKNIDTKRRSRRRYSLRTHILQGIVTSKTAIYFVKFEVYNILRWNVIEYKN